MTYYRKPLTQSERFKILERDNFTCRYCGRGAPDVVLHVDHIVPVSRGGDNSPGNLVTACSNCNQGKAARPLRPAPVVIYRPYPVYPMPERLRLSLEAAHIESFNHWLSSMAEDELLIDISEYPTSEDVRYAAEDPVEREVEL